MTVNTGRVWLLYGALKSGLYPQGSGRLHFIADSGKDMWCCLGVAGDVASRYGLEVSCDTFSSYEGLTVYIDGEPEYLPEKIRDWYGFDSRDPEPYTPDGRLIRASKWNDSGYGSGLSFHPPDMNEIAEGFRRTFLDENRKEK